ncbi:PREDICTED: uncharacterized protein LOC107346686 isoform X4 [Acropora digitifera]|uniref:uncharacterized protein LOC107346686 isoform X4 n=1 Tax=Acropora digitifera TaxID=70779 RepID=UPI00077AF724|nr:PREDICTED: uncharacterized protein LOC107346686 isoform X4 [Acropora digitifera]
MANEEKVDLIMALKDDHGFQKAIEKLLNQADPTVGVLALEGLFRIKNQGTTEQREEIRSFLQRWRNDNRSGYQPIHNLKKDLRELTIFKTHEVPLFIDDYGDKNLLSSYEETEEEVIDSLNEKIYHVTHLEEAMSIAINKELKGSNNKNIMEGCWFGIDSKPEKPKSVYGSRYFETTLSKLGVGGLRQGEIVYYKQEVNVILYADNEGDADGVKKPTDASARRWHGNRSAYVKVSIFVPKRFLPKPDKFDQVISGPFKVEHGGFCVRAKRTFKACFELCCEKWMKDVRRKENPAKIIQEIMSSSKETLEDKFRAFFNLFAETCIPGPFWGSYIPGPLVEEKLSNYLKASFAYRRNPYNASEASFAYRRNPYNASERGFTTWRRASGAQAVAVRDDANDRDDVGYKALMKALRRKEDAAIIIQRIKSWSGPKLEERIRAFFNLLAESCLPDSQLSERALSNHLATSSKYRRQLLDAFESEFTTSEQASGDQTGAECDDDDDDDDDEGDDDNDRDDECYETLMKAVEDRENPATIIQKITLWSGPTDEEKIRAFFKLLSECCLDSLSWEDDPLYGLEASTEYRRRLLEAFESAFLTSKQASGDQTGAELGYKALMNALSRKEDPAAIIQMMKSWSGPKLKEKIRAFFNLLAESCVERLALRKTSFKYGRQLLHAFERCFLTSKQACRDERGAERDDDDDTDGGT